MKAAASKKLAETVEAKSIPGEISRASPGINWVRVFAGVLTSKLFFVASCTGGMLLGAASMPDFESGAHGERVRPLDPLMSVVAVIPKADKPGGQEVVQTSLGNLERFKKETPGYSFMLPPGKGEVGELMLHTEYAVTAVEPGKVLVETRLSQDDNHVQGKYEATDQEIKPLYTKSSNDFLSFMTGTFVFGLPAALLLASIGYVLKWHLKRTTGLDSPESETGAKDGKSNAIVGEARLCPKCGYSGPMKSWLRGHSSPQILALIGLSFYIIPGLIFIAWGWGKCKCPECGTLVKAGTKPTPGE